MPNDGPSAASPFRFAYTFDAPQDGAPIVVHSEYDIAPYLRVFLLNWPCRATGLDRPADILLRRVGQGIAAWLASDPSEQLDGLGDLDGVNKVADLLSHVAARRRDGLAELHSSAVLIGGRLVLFVGPSLSGKSTLALQLAARGHRLFGDDRLLVGPLNGAPRDNGAFGIALGLTPRVRHPPHPKAGAAFAEFVARSLIKGSGGVGFLPLPADILASCGETAPLGALVLPQRRDSGGLVFEPASSSAVSRVVLEQMHAPQIPAARFLAAARDLTEGLPCWHLHYDDSAQAAMAVAATMAAKTAG